MRFYNSLNGLTKINRDMIALLYIFIYMMITIITYRIFEVENNKLDEIEKIGDGFIIGLSINWPITLIFLIMVKIIKLIYNIICKIIK